MIISVVVPCYNVGKHIADVVKEIPSDVSFIIVVNDYSQDNTEEILLGLEQEDTRVICIHHKENQGVGGSMITGYLRALELESDIIIKMDGDHQMDASYIPVLIKPLLEDKADFTKGNRFRDLNALRKMPIVRRFGNLALSFMIKSASGYWNIFDPTNGYTAIKKEALKNIIFNKLHRRYFFESSMLIELYHANAVVMDISMKARYGNEVSGLSITKTLFEFPPKLLMAFIKRILLKYYLFEFNIGSLYIFFGLLLFIAGSIYGIVNYMKYAGGIVSAPTGTIVISTLLIILGFQLLLSAANYDINNFPKRNNL